MWYEIHHGKQGQKKIYFQFDNISLVSILYDILYVYPFVVPILYLGVDVWQNSWSCRSGSLYTSFWWAIFGYFMEVSSWCFLCETNWIVLFFKWSTSHIIRPCNKIYATTFVKLYQIIDFGDPVYVLWFTCSQNLLGFPTFRLRAYLMNVIPKTRRVH